MTEPFRLTPWEPPPEPRRPYQIQHEGQDWRGMSGGDFNYWVERFTTYPADARRRIEDGETVASTYRGQRFYLRRTPTAGEVEDARRQMAMF